MLGGPGLSAVAVILQARMGSTRLPGKVLLPLAGRPMLEWIIRRLRDMRRADRLVLATTGLPADDRLVELAEGLGVPAFRGSAEDVLDRYHRCAEAFDAGAVVRATADNPFVDPGEGDRLVDLFESSGADYACAFPTFGSGLPVGVGLEIFTRAALARSWREGTRPNHREHVDEYIQENPGLFRCEVLRARPELRAPDLSLTVDTPADFQVAEELYDRFPGTPKGEYPPVEWAIQERARCT